MEKKVSAKPMQELLKRLVSWNMIFMCCEFS